MIFSLMYPGMVYTKRTRKIVRTVTMNSTIMYLLYRFQIKNTKVFTGFTNQLKDVFGRLEQEEKNR